MTLYRYFLCLCPSHPARHALDALRARQNWTRRIVEANRLHMTLAVLTETDLPWRDCAERVAVALDPMILPACIVRLNAFKGGMLVSRDRLSAVHRLQSDIVSALLRHRLPVVRRPETLHVTLTYAATKPRIAAQPIEWRARLLTLIESHLGEHCHVPLAEWALSEAAGFPPPPRQLNLWPDALVG